MTAKCHGVDNLLILCTKKFNKYSFKASVLLILVILPLLICRVDKPIIHNYCCENIFVMELTKNNLLQCYIGLTLIILREVIYINNFYSLILFPCLIINILHQVSAISLTNETFTVKYWTCHGVDLLCVDILKE